MEATVTHRRKIIDLKEDTFSLKNNLKLIEQAKKESQE